MSFTTTELWVLIIGLAIGSFLIRYSFLGLLGGRQMPDWVLRHLRYTPVAVLPGLVAPLVIWPEATIGGTDPVRLAAALATLAVGVGLRSTNWAVVAGAAVLIGGLTLTG